MKVVQLRDVRSRLRPGRPVRPPPALSGSIPAATRVQADEAFDDRVRMRQNMAALIVTVAILVLGAWLIDSLRHYSRLQACIEAGHRNCAPLEPKLQPSPYSFR